MLPSLSRIKLIQKYQKLNLMLNFCIEKLKLFLNFRKLKKKIFQKK